MPELPDDIRLPKIVAEIADAIGRDAAFAIVVAKGGQRVSIPRRPGPNHWLVRAVGPELAQKLADHFSVGNTGVKDLDVPLVTQSRYAQRRKRDREEFVYLFNRGYSLNEVAARMGLSRRSAIRAKNRLAAEDMLA